MSQDKKPIGVCLAQAHTYLKTNLVSELDRAARDYGYGIIVFNSSLDYYWTANGNDVTGCIYDIVRYDMLSALVILHDNIFDLPLLNNMVESARKNHIPALYLGGVRDDCVSIVDDYENAYKALLRHVIRDHGVTDTFYISGLQNEDNSIRRLRYYREVLEECGLPYREENVAWGSYLDTAAADIVRDLIEHRDHLPRAIMCANDSMAAAACDELKAHGYRIPEDVIVTGFDGTPTAWLVSPQLSTCSTNPASLADLVIRLTEQFYAGEPLEKVYRHEYRTVLTESCGCPPRVMNGYSALHTFRQAEAFTNHENTMYYAIEQLMEMKDQLEILRKLSSILLPDSVLYLNRSLLEADPEKEYSANRIEDELIMIPYRKPGADLIFKKVYRKDLPLPERTWHTGASVLNVIHSSGLVCGYYAAYTADLNAETQLIKRLSDVLNLIFAVLSSRQREAQLKARLESNLYRDPVTGLLNLRGLTRWFSQYVTNPDHHQKLLCMSVYAISRYSWIFETYGMEETEECARAVARGLENANAGAEIVARLSEDQFAVVNSGADADAISEVVNRSVPDFFRQLDTYNARSRKPFYLEVNCGATSLEIGWNSTSLENLIHLAVGEMYLNRLRDGVREEAVRAPIGQELYGAFSLLLEKNLFRFFFQPIVDAHTGQIYAYEALMRTDGVVNLTPLQVLATAREFNRLYDVERATVTGIIEHFIRHYSDFHGCRVFINTIPGHFLTPEDCATVMARYGSYLDCFVLELTEDEPTTDDELERMKRLCRPGSQMDIAIDDYGMGHSNIVNLLRYSPQIIKVDRALIAGIEKDDNRQLFVRNTIDFAHQNGIRVLAEGVETSAELRMLISLGIDLVQGFYTGRPAAQPLQAVNEKIRAEIVEENLHSRRYDNKPLTYTLRDGESASIVDLALKKITCIQIGSGTFTLTGDKSQNVDMILRVEDNASATITLNQVNMRGATEPTVQLGHHARVTLILSGQNTLTKEGIIVPPSTTLIIRGDGNLRINNNRNYSAGIGARYNEPYGTIILDISGKISFVSSGDRVVCLGGGRSGGDGIKLAQGSYDMTANGINVLCVGSSMGKAAIDIGRVTLSAHGEGNEVLLIGSVSGECDIRSVGQLQLSAACERATGIGTISGNAEIRIDGGSIFSSIRCDSGAVIGTFSGESNAKIGNALLRLHGEGNQVVGFGSLMGAADTLIESGEIHGEILAGQRLMMGNQHSRCTVTGGNFHLSNDDSVLPVGPDGEELTYVTPPEDHFERVFTGRRKTWTYIADRNAEGTLGIFIPES